MVDYPKEFQKNIYYLSSRCQTNQMLLSIQRLASCTTLPLATLVLNVHLNVS